ncbi:MAG: hypothetical protein WC725_04765 [Patescibacteria group bacterium]|jgi:hypothetical protein
MINIYQNLYNVSIDNMLKMIATLPVSVHVKNANTGKYIVSNQANLEIYKLNNIKEIIGLTLSELDIFMRPFWGNAFVDKVNEMDKLVVSSGKFVHDKQRVFLDKTGFVHYQNMYKIPFASRSNSKKIIAILTNSDDYTKKVDLITLLRSYLGIYASKPRALAMFMEYLDLKKFFYEPLTEKELMCLLHAKNDDVRINMAVNIGVTIKTIEAHVSNIKSKLIYGNIDSVVKHLRGV